MRLGLVALVVLEVDLELDSGQLCWEVIRPKTRVYKRLSELSFFPG